MAATRREFITRSVAVTVAGGVSGLFAAQPALAAPGGGYGPLVPDQDGLLDLPRGFRYRVLSREGAELASGGGKVPSNFDGMAVFPRRGGGAHLVRNHENRPDAPIPVPQTPSHTYDPGGKGGTSTLVVGEKYRLEEEYVSLAGTSTNCAGGPSPWHTWLSCEENEDKAGTNGYTKDHGFIFEVDPYDNERNAEPTPLTAMGRFQHEAVAVDPRTGIVYETEDSFEPPYGLFYRFLPEKPLGGYGSLRAGGRLEAMRVPGVPDLSVVQEPGTVFEKVEWVRVPDPLATDTPTKLQDYGPAGISRAQKLEGAWWGEHDRCAYITSSFARSDEGSAATHDGQVWKYDPKRGTITLEVIFRRDADTPEDQKFQQPDNITMAPYGGLMICEDGDGENYVMGLTADGEPYHFARNRQNSGTPEEPVFGEFAGVGFSPSGRTMFVNCYRPGTTFAITGPWHWDK
jgi:uncharacterized protein